MTDTALAKIDGQYARDMSTQIIINTDMSEYHAIVQQRKIAETGNNISNMQNQIDRLANDFAEIKMMLSQLIGNNNV